jgi:hypothetical protein
MYFNISNITINIKKMYKKNHFTFHHYWGGGFCPVPTKIGPDLEPTLTITLLMWFLIRERLVIIEYKDHINMHYSSNENVVLKEEWPLLRGKM